MSYIRSRWAVLDGEKPVRIGKITFAERPLKDDGHPDYRISLPVVSYRVQDKDATGDWGWEDVTPERLVEIPCVRPASRELRKILRDAGVTTKLRITSGRNRTWVRVADWEADHEAVGEQIFDALRPMWNDWSSRLLLIKATGTVVIDRERYYETYPWGRFFTAES